MKSQNDNSAQKAVLLNMAGVIVSGLVFPLLAMWFAPQPPWKDAALFSQSFHPLQTFTYFAGFLLITGSLLVFVALTLKSAPGKRFHAMAALAVHILFAALVYLNYILQTTYVPYLASRFPEEAVTLLPALSMANPGSLAWALEMYGWGGIGFSYLLMIPAIEPENKGQLLKYLFAGNGICSIVAALMTSLDMEWIFTIYGLGSLITWNLLVLVTDVYLLGYFRMRKN